MLVALFWLRPFTVLQPLISHPNPTLRLPLCHPCATLIPPLCHPWATLIPPLCHPNATLMPPLCHLTCSSLAGGPPRLFRLRLRQTQSTADVLRLQEHAQPPTPAAASPTRIPPTPFLSGEAIPLSPSLLCHPPVSHVWWGGERTHGADVAVFSAVRKEGRVKGGGGNVLMHIHICALSYTPYSLRFRIRTTETL